MYIEENCIDDVMNKVFQELLKEPHKITNTKGDIYEKLGIYITLTNPLARLSFTQTRGYAISPLGELLWYLSGSNEVDFIQYYLPMYKNLSDDGKIIHGAYGPRLFKMHDNINQIEEVVNLLKQKPTTKRAVIQLYDASDLQYPTSKDIPCTCTIQFLIRNGRLHLFVHMRSNDAYRGLYHDTFCFTMLQEIIAIRLNVELGNYHVFVSSMHIYNKDIPQAKLYIKEGFQSTKQYMPPMPVECIEESITTLFESEAKIRCKEEVNLDEMDLACYWKDILYLLKTFSLQKEKKTEEIIKIKEKITYKGYKTLIEEKYNNP